MNGAKPNENSSSKGNIEESSSLPHYSIATSFASVYSDESTSTKILGMPAAAESVRGSRSSVKAHDPMSPRELEEAKKKAIKEYKKMPQFLQYAGEIIKRDKELEKRGEWIEISKEPQRIYDAMQEKEKKKKLRKRLLKYGLPAFFLLVLIISSVAVLLPSEDESRSIDESTPEEEYEQDRENIPDPSPQSDQDTETENLVCDDQLELCDFEVEQLCQNCSCLQSMDAFGSEELRNVYVIDIRLQSNLLFNVEGIRANPTFDGACDSCESAEKSQCDNEAAECCLDILSLD
eukprot:snap_masked-scaffold_8-processed-gene-14.67-mRNA-1 protein AED:1.00 eAED:1.00 QI:0/0/0/0/1/1/3/0/290